LKRATSWEDIANILKEDLEERNMSIEVERVEVWTREVDWRDKRRGKWRHCTWEQSDSCLTLPFMDCQEAHSSHTNWRRILGAGLGKWEGIAVWLDKILSYYSTLVIFGNLEVLFCFFLLLFPWFVILIKYSSSTE